MITGNAPAYPVDNPNYDGNWDDRKKIGGLTVRQYYAAKAMQAFISAGFGANDDTAREAFVMAESMLHVEQKENNQ